MKEDFIGLVLNASAHTLCTVLWGPSSDACVCLGEQMFRCGKALLRSAKPLVSSKLGWQQKRRKGQGNWVGVGLTRKWC